MVFRTPEKQDRTVWFWVKIAAAALVLGFGVWLMFFQNISVSLSETELYVTGGVGNSRTVPYADITGVEWLQTLDKGEANNAMRTRTMPFLPPGMAPLTRIRFCSSSTRITVRFLTVTVSQPM